MFRLYHNKYLPLEEQETDLFMKCQLAYRFFVSSLEYLGFRYVGRSDKNLDYISDELVVGIKELLENQNFKKYEQALHNEIAKGIYSKK